MARTFRLQAVGVSNEQSEEQHRDRQWADCGWLGNQCERRGRGARVDVGDFTHRQYGRVISANGIRCEGQHAWRSRKSYREKLIQASPRRKDMRLGFAAFL